ncbi:hypothetical protein SAEN111111_00840 [Saccharibacillus endophyticus]
MGEDATGREGASIAVEMRFLDWKPWSGWKSDFKGEHFVSSLPFHPFAQAHRPPG